MAFSGKKKVRGTKKPISFKEMIEKACPGWSRVEIFKDEGLQIW